MVGLYSSFIIAILISFFGGRPAMIFAAKGAMSISLQAEELFLFQLLYHL